MLADQTGVADVQVVVNYWFAHIHHSSLRKCHGI
jgi:hypothetical protein